MAIELAKIERAKYCIQCTDKSSGKIGDFLYKDDFKAISPVFSSLTELYQWMKINGWIRGGSFDCYR